MITLSKIAKLAHVSVSTASKAFSGSTEVNDQTREMIFKVAKEHGCFKKFYNVKYPKLVIAIIAPEFDSAYYTRYLSHIQKNLGRQNCELCVSTTDFSEEYEKALLEYYCKYSDVDGVIMINSHTAITENYEIPIAFINPVANRCGGITVYSDLKPAICEAVDYLIDKKVKSVGFIGEKLTSSKLRLLKEISEEKGLAFDEQYVSIADKRFEKGGYSAMENLFKKEKVPRAIVCGYDYMAIGVIRCIYDHGLSVPEDIAVLGIDDVAEAEYLNPSLASISSPVKQLCEIATEALIRQINGETDLTYDDAPCELKLRRSFEI